MLVDWEWSETTRLEGNSTFFQVLKEISCQVKILYYENTFMKEGELKILYKGKWNENIVCKPTIKNG